MFSEREIVHISETGFFYGADVLSATQLSVSKHRREHKTLTLTSGLASYSLLCAYVRKHFCRMQVLQFFVRAIHYQFVKIVLHVRAAHNDHILFMDRIQWACSLSSVFGLSVYF